MSKIAKIRTLAACLALMVFCPAANTVQAQNFSSYTVAGLTSSSYDARKNDSDSIITLKAVNAFSKWDNFIFADISSPGHFSDHGSVYIEWAPRISLGKSINGNAMQFGIIRDVYVIGELNHFHNKSGTNTTKLYGLSVDLALPGFNFVKMHLENRDDPSLSGSTEQFTLAWNYPFAIGRYRFSFEGFADYAGSEGDRSPNVLTQPQIVWKANDHLHVGLEYQYWRNKFGINGLKESAMQALVRWNF